MCVPQPESCYRFLSLYWIAQYISPNPGRIINLSTGESIATHQGLWSFTIGQGAKLPGMSEKMYVARKDITTNTVFVVCGM
jgi:tRNA U34 2-thiouridine synthase MnmA/TrmU